MGALRTAPASGGSDSGRPPGGGGGPGEPGGAPGLAEEDGEMSEGDSQELAAAEGEDTEDRESTVADPNAI